MELAPDYITELLTHCFSRLRFSRPTVCVGDDPCSASIFNRVSHVLSLKTNNCLLIDTKG